MYRRRTKSRRGAAAMLAMMFIGLVATLSVAMFSMGTQGVQSASNLSDATAARSAAESGLRWQAYRLLTMPRPVVSAGRITRDVAVNEVWPGLNTRIKNDYNALTKAYEKSFDKEGTETLIVDGESVACPWITSKEIALDDGSARFKIKIQFIPRRDPRTQILRVTSFGYSGPSARRAVRSATIDFDITKKVKFAVVGKVPIQLGRNAIVEGPLGTTSLVTSSRPTPLLMLSDFMHLKPSLTSKVEDFNEFLRATHAGYDNRVSVNNPTEYAAAVAAEFVDANEDGYVDEYDLFLAEFDADGDQRISLTEFTNPATGTPYDHNLFKAIDGLAAPMFNEDKNANGALDAGEDQNGNGSLDIDEARIGFEDGYIDNYDGYAKVRGEIRLAATAASWQNHLNSNDPGVEINDKIQGTIAPTDPTAQPIEFGTGDIFDLAPQNFEEAAANFKAKTGSAAGPTIRVAGRIENALLAASDTTYSTAAVQLTGVPTGALHQVGDIMSKAAFDAYNAGKTSAAQLKAANGNNAAVEKTPFGSSSWQATYKRPIFKDMALKNVQVPKGLNAVFDNCTFEGVTWVETERDIKTSAGSVTTSSGEGMNWAQRRIAGDTFAKDKVLLGAAATPVAGQTTTHGSQKGNNLRFNNCTFEGPLANNYATAYTHFSNSMEFTGATMFDNKVDQTATLVCPQTNIEMGSFTSPTSAPSTMVGVVVAGNIDIRGTSVVDGSIIITGDGAGNTTLAYFGGSDSETNPGAMPEGGFGRLNIRYNDQRALPDGIRIPIDLIATPGTYREGTKHEETN